MLNQLDTLIGFAVVMAVVSLLITIVTQMVSAALGLRGKYLAAALETMIHKIDPTINGQVCGLGKQLSQWILTHPVLSDSILPMAANQWDKIPVLRWFRRRWRIASAIRPDELFQVLQDIGAVKPEKALAKLQLAQQAADKAMQGLKESAVWQEILADAETVAKLAEDKAKEEKNNAITAAKNLEAMTDATAREAATKEVGEKSLAAKEATAIATQAREIARKAGDAANDPAQARQFALEAAMRAAAIKVLAALYVPPPVEKPSAPKILAVTT